MKSARAGPVGDCPEGWREALVAHLARSISHRARDLGAPPAEGGGQRVPPLVDRAHRPMQIRETGEQNRVDACQESQGRWRRNPFARIVQALIERAEGGSEERTILESIGNHARTRVSASASALRRESLL